MEHRIRWNDEEIDMVCADAVRRLAELHASQPDLFGALDALAKRQVEEALFESQLMLPVGRRKKDFGSLIYGRLDKAVRKGLRSEAARRKSMAGQPRLPAPLPATPATSATPAPDTVTVPELSLAEVFLGAIAGGIRRAGDADGVAEILAILSPPVAANDTVARKPPIRVEAAPVMKRKSKVAVIGLLPAQQRAIERECPHLDMRFWNYNEAAQRVGAITAGVDTAVVMTRFVPHKIDKQIKSATRINVGGGMTELARVLKARYAVAA